MTTPPIPRPFHTVASCFLGWTLDAFDFFIMIFVMSDIAASFNVSISRITWAITLTLALRVLGATLFGRLADYYGRKPALLVNILLFSIFECGSGFAPNLTIFLIMRSLYGIAMGGEWGIGTSLAMESVPPKARGMVSGILQSGYSVGYLLAALLYGIGFSTLGWRGMFMVAILPAFLVLYIRQSVPESPIWAATQERKPRSLLHLVTENWKALGYAILLMTAASVFSHGTQDLYPTFLRVQHGMTVHQIASIAVIYNIGAILGCLCGGTLSQYLGRRRLIILATIFGAALTPFWGLASQPVALAGSAFLMQFLVQCTFGVLPAHLNEIAPADARGTFSGFVYQIGNMLTAANATWQATLAHDWHDNYGLALAVTVAGGAICFSILAALGTEHMRGDLGSTPSDQHKES